MEESKYIQQLQASGWEFPNPGDIFPKAIQTLNDNFNIMAEFSGRNLLTKSDCKRDKRRLYRRQRQNKRKSV